jgi:hypothetical protein
VFGLPQGHLAYAKFTVYDQGPKESWRPDVIKNPFGMLKVKEITVADCLSEIQEVIPYVKIEYATGSLMFDEGALLKLKLAHGISITHCTPEGTVYAEEGTVTVSFDQ